MSSAEYLADNVQKILNNIWGKRVHPEAEKQAVLAAVEKELRLDDPFFLKSGSLAVDAEGKKIVVDVLMAGYGSAEHPAWVAFLLYESGFGSVRRPLTDDTATMPWLNEYVMKEFIGFNR